MITDDAGPAAPGARPCCASRNELLAYTLRGYIVKGTAHG